MLKIVNVIQNARKRGYPQIDPNMCVRCGMCVRSCHHEAVAGQPEKHYRIDQQRCFRCYHCMENCPKGAITVSK